MSDLSLEHIGTKRHSGRYPWGSGGDPYQNALSFKAMYNDLRTQGLTKAEIAEGMGLVNYKGKGSSTDLIAQNAIATESIKSHNIATAKNLKEKGMKTTAIAKQMGAKNESTVRGWLKPSEDLKQDSLRGIADALKLQAITKPFLDIGKGTHLWMGVTFTRLNTAAAILKDEGFRIHTGIKVPQLGTDKETEYKILTKDDVTWGEARKAVLAGNHQVVAAQSDDGGLTFKHVKEPPVAISSKRIEVRWKEDGGDKMDGIIELRRDVADLSLGANRYGQVRVAVDGTHYLKGMAMYADNLPPGVDIRFNTPKPMMVDGVESTKLSSMKPMKLKPDGEIDEVNPFGAKAPAHLYIDKNGKEKTSPLGMVNEEGRWDEWSNNLSSQMLSKQSVTLAKAQLKEARVAKEEDLKKILSLNHPVVRQKLLEEYADSADAAAVHLKAAMMPRQSTHVILPINSIRRHEVFAPNFTQGEKVVLVRHPHSGPFEIPSLTVNNNNPLAKRILGGAKDAIGIHYTVAEQLSGADFDGDTVLVIPNDLGKVKNQAPLARLTGFEPKIKYNIADDDETTTRMTKQNTQTEMGKISNLITDMNIKGAHIDDIALAVRHSMVVIDAEKHGLDYKQSAKDHQITRLKEVYQSVPGKTGRGASTIISRSSSDAWVPERKYVTQIKTGKIDPKTGKEIMFGKKGINPETGEKLYIETGNTRKVPINPTTGKKLKRPDDGFTSKDYENTIDKPKETKGSKMEFTKDARELLSGDPKAALSERGTLMERTYADHANAMKGLANLARKEYVAIPNPPWSNKAKTLYADEVTQLDAMLKIALRNAPLERRAQAIGGADAKARIASQPGLDKDDQKKLKFDSLENARNLTGAGKKKIGGSPEMALTERHWQAIQAGALSATKLREILTNANMERVKELATPRARTAVTTSQMARARQLSSQGKSLVEIAERLGIPRSTLADNLANG